MSYKPKEPFTRKATFSHEQEFTKLDAGDSFGDDELPRKSPSVAKNKRRASQSKDLIDKYGRKR